MLQHVYIFYHLPMLLCWLHNIHQPWIQVITEEYQEKDPELMGLKKKALDDQEIQRVPFGYYHKGGVLMRKF